MVFCDSIEKDEYEDFVSSHPTKSHFMQSTGWGEFNRIERKLTPYYVGLKDEGRLVAAALLLMRKPFLFPPYFYSPRGFVIDFFDHQLLTVFCNEVSNFCRAIGAMFLKIDPDIELYAINEQGQPIVEAGDNRPLIDKLKQLGFTHLGFNKEFERRQPRYTFRIDLTPTKQEILAAVRGNVLKNVRKCETNYLTEIYEGGASDVENLYRLIHETSLRDEFYAYSEGFYKNFYDVLSRYDMVKLYMGKIYIHKTIESLKQQLMLIQAQKEGYTKPQKIRQAKETEQRLIKEISQFEHYAEQYGHCAVTAAHLVVRYGDKAWAVHAGSSGDMNETFLNNRLYLHKIIDQKDNGAVLLDQFGTVGDWQTSTHRSLHEFKRQFGGRYIEFLGEFDLVIRRFWYNIYVNTLPRYRNGLFNLKAVVRKVLKR